MASASGAPIAAVAAELDRRWPDPFPTLALPDAWDTLVAVILASGTSDTRARHLAAVLAEHCTGPIAYRERPPSDLEPLLTGLPRRRARARAIVEAAGAVVRHHGGQVPLSHAALAALPGLGPWRADRLLAEYAGRPAPLIDIDVARVVRRLGWVAGSGHLPAIHAAVAQRCAREHWIQRSLQLRAIGRGPCRPQCPRCRRCVLRASCPSAGMG